jgi:hypothetical protein
MGVRKTVLGEAQFGRRTVGGVCCAWYQATTISVANRFAIGPRFNPDLHESKQNGHNPWKRQIGKSGIDEEINLPAYCPSSGGWIAHCD